MSKDMGKVTAETQSDTCLLVQLYTSSKLNNLTTMIPVLIVSTRTGTNLQVILIVR